MKDPQFQGDSLVSSFSVWDLENPASENDAMVLNTLIQVAQHQ